MWGRAVATVAAPASTTPKTTAASHTWRRRITSARVIGESRVGSRGAIAISGHDQRVAWPEEKRLDRTLGNDLVVVARNPGHLRTLDADDRHLRATSEIVEPSGEHERAENGSSAPQVEAAGLSDFPDHRHLQAVDLADHD